MTTITSTTFKSTIASIVLHGVFLALGSVLVYQNSPHTLELSGNSGGKNFISLTGFSSGASIKKGNTLNPKTLTKEKALSTNAQTIPLETSKNPASSTAHSTGSAAATTAAEEFGSSTGTGSATTTGSGNGSGTGSGSVGMGEHDYLFPQIKNFFENRLGSTLNIRERQFIKIKIALGGDGEILDAVLAQGKLEGSILRRVLSVAKNIPLKNFWKSGSYPKELIIPLVLTPQ